MRISQLSQLVVGLRFYHSKRAGMSGYPCRITSLTDDVVFYRTGQDGTRDRHSAPTELFLASHHEVLDAGDIGVPEVVV